MNILNKLLAIAVLLSVSITPACGSTSRFVAIPSMGSLTAEVGNWIAIEVQVYIAKTLCAARATGTTPTPSVTILEGNHMIIEAKRLPADTVPFRGLSGPRKARSQS
jgi:hypothetical protein